MAKNKYERKPVNRSQIPYALGMLLSIALVMLGLFVAVPYLFRIFHPALAYIAFILLAPAFPSISTILQGEQRPSFITFWVLYIIDLISLLFQLFILLMFIPNILLSIGLIFSAMFFVVDVIGIILWLLRFVAGLDIASGLDRASINLILIGFPATLGTFFLILFINPLIEKYVIAFLRSVGDKLDEVRKNIWQNI
jgi:hypothetical protein